MGWFLPAAKSPHAQVGHHLPAPWSCCSEPRSGSSKDKRLQQRRRGAVRTSVLLAGSSPAQKCQLESRKLSEDRVEPVFVVTSAVPCAGCRLSAARGQGSPCTPPHSDLSVTPSSNLAEMGWDTALCHPQSGCQVITEWLGWEGPQRLQHHTTVGLEGTLRIIEPWDGWVGKALTAPRAPPQLWAGCPPDQAAHPAWPHPSVPTCSPGPPTGSSFWSRVLLQDTALRILRCN